MSYIESGHIMIKKYKKFINSLPLLDGELRMFTAKVTRDPKTMKKDFTFGPGHKSIKGGNVDCIHTGNGLTVVDVDDKNSDEKIDPKLRKLLPKSPTVKTYNGDHYYFINADWLKQTQGLTEMVDVRNAQGTGLVACNYTGNDETIFYKVASGVIYDLDDPKYKKLKKMLSRLQEAHQTARISLIEKSFVDGEPWVSAGDGKHHDFLQDMAMLSVRGGMDSDYIWSRYEEYYESYLSPRKKTREDTKMESRIDWALGHIKPRTELKGKRLTGDTLTDEIETMVKGVPAERSDKLKTKLKTKQYNTLASKPVETMVIAGIPYPTKGITMLASEGGVGKSFISIQLAVSYLMQNPKEKVLFWFTEDYEAIVRARVSMITTDKSITSRMVFIVSDVKDIDELKPLIKLSKKFGMTILDPLISFFDGDENSNKDAREFYNDIKKLHGLIILIHHSSKGGETSRGASDFRNGVRMVYKVVKPELIFRQSTRVKKCDDVDLLGKRAILMDKDNWGISQGHPVNCRTDEMGGYLMDCFPVSNEYELTVRTLKGDIEEELAKVDKEGAKEYPTPEKTVRLLNFTPSHSKYKKTKGIK